MDYFKITYENDFFEAHQRDTPSGESLKLTEDQLTPVGSPKKIIARFDDLRTIFESLYPEVEADGRKANAFMQHELKNDGLTRMIQFYLIPTE